MEMGSEIVCIPKLDFSGLEPATTAGRDALQGQVLRALESYGCFEVVYDRVTPELRDALFGRAIPEVFALPLEVKMLNKSDIPYEGYNGQIPGLPYESLEVKGDAEEFAQMLWPQGNRNFCDTVSEYERHLKFLEQTIVWMVFVGLGIEKYYDSYIESASYAVRLSEYGIPLDQEHKIVLSQHVDSSLVTIVCQNLIEGLEIHIEDAWIPVLPSPNSFTVFVGESLQAWTNGRLVAPLHRVRMTRNVKRYSVSFNSVPKDGCIIETPKELVDEEHPLRYRPYSYEDHMLFRYSEQGPRYNTTLYDFCGIEGGTATRSTEIPSCECIMRLSVVAASDGCQ